MSEWISVEDRLPDRFEEVIAWAPDGYSQTKMLIKMVSYTGTSWAYGYYNNSLSGVTHWMPLPPPPEAV